MTFAESIQAVFRNYATFTGRAARAEYWWWVLFVFLVTLGLSVVDATAFPQYFNTPERNHVGPVTAIFFLIIFLPSLGVAVRRLHDINKSGWWVLIQLVPLIGWLILLYWTTRKGDNGSNDYGLDPTGLVAKLMP